MNPKFPLFVDLGNRTVLVYGGGAIALRRVQTLARFGPEICVVAPVIRPELRALADCAEAVYCAEEMPAADFVLAATDDAAVNHAIVTECRRRGIPVNNASDQSECDFQFPGIAMRGSVVVGVNAGGADHALVKRLAAAIRVLLEKE